MVEVRSMERIPVKVPLKTTENLSRKVVKIMKKDVISRDRKEKCRRGPQPL